MRSRYASPSSGRAVCCEILARPPDAVAASVTIDRGWATGRRTSPRCGRRTAPAPTATRTRRSLRTSRAAAISTRASRGWSGKSLHLAAERRDLAAARPRRAARAASSRTSGDRRPAIEPLEGFRLGAPARIDSSGPERSTRWISASRCGRRRSRASHSRRTSPGPRRAARPAR